MSVQKLYSVVSILLVVPPFAVSIYIENTVKNDICNLLTSRTLYEG